MTMPQIHAVLIEKQRTEAEEAQRLVAFTLNASAGVAMCQGRHAEAIAHYREVLRLEAAGAADGLGLRLDALQRLHALHNLRLALDAAANAAANAAATDRNDAPDGLSVPVSRALRDDTLASDAETERQKYVAQRRGGAAFGERIARKATAGWWKTRGVGAARAGAARAGARGGPPWWTPRAPRPIAVARCSIA